MSLLRGFCGIAVFLLLDNKFDVPVPFWSVLIGVAVLIILAEITDGLDGWWARKYNQVTNFGKLLDPMADSIYRFLVFLAFVEQGWMPMWMVATIFFRDITVSYARSLAAINGIVVDARWSGKVKAVVQGITQGAVIVMQFTREFVLDFPADDIGWWCLFMATLWTSISWVDYMLDIIPKAIMAEAAKRRSSI